MTMLNDSNIMATMESRRISWTGHVGWGKLEQLTRQVTRWIP